MGILFGALLMLLHRYDERPAALSNDAAQEIQSGVLLIERMQVRIMAFDPSHNGVETLWVYLMGLTTKLLGPGVLAAVVPSWIAYLMLLIATGLLARQLRARPWIWMLIALSLPWTFHFARSGFRALACAGLTMIVLLCFARFVSSARSAGRGASMFGAVLLGATLGLSTYVYTAGRAVVIAFLVFCVIESFRRWRMSARHGHRLCWQALKPFLRVSIAMFVVLLPWLVLLVIDPASVVGRGSYNIRADVSTGVEFVLRSIAVPFGYDFDRFMPGSGTDWLFEAVTNQLIAARVNPVPHWVGVFALVGLWRMFKGRPTERAVARFALVIMLTTCVLIGFMGPSLSRLMPMAASVIVLAGLGFSALGAGIGRYSRTGVRPGANRSVDARFGAERKIESDRDGRILVRRVWVASTAVLLVGLCLFEVDRYFDRIDQSPARGELGLVAQPAALRARDHAARGDRVMIFLYKDAQVLAYLIHGEPRKHIGYVESFRTPIDAEALPDAVWSMDVFLVEDHPHTRAVIEHLRDRFRSGNSSSNEPIVGLTETAIGPGLLEFRLPE